jgi:quinolinate synthase
MSLDIIRRIDLLRRQKNAVILAHYYTPGPVQDIADFVGDSLALARRATETDADIILFAGVHFMAETAKILCPARKVLIPDLNAGCSLAESCPSEAFEEFIAAHPGHKVVSYVNTSAAVKAVTDVCCTSSNALAIVESFPRSQPLIFAPDVNLGTYIKSKTKRENMVLWDGACHVHKGFSVPSLLQLKSLRPRASVLAHPECTEQVLHHADFIGSTAAILDHARESSATEFIVVTEPGILHKLQAENPSKSFFPLSGADGACNQCEYMKLMTLEKIYDTLKHESPEVIVDPSISRRANNSIEAMLATK